MIDFTSLQILTYKILFFYYSDFILKIVPKSVHIKWDEGNRTYEKN